MGLAMYSWRQTASRRHLAAARARTIGDEVTRTETGVMIYCLFLGWPGTGTDSCLCVAVTATAAIQYMAARTATPARTLTQRGSAAYRR
jgi:hypothetical protein